MMLSILAQLNEEKRKSGGYSHVDNEDKKIPSLTEDKKKKIQVWPFLFKASPHFSNNDFLLYLNWIKKEYRRK